MEFNYQGFEFSIRDDGIKGILFIAVSGAHAYGWARDDSDLDLRQVWLPDLAQTISPFFRAQTKSWDRKCQKGIMDFVSYPIHNYLRLLAKGNGNITENLFQTKLFEKTRLVKELQDIVLKNLHKGHLKHYWGYSVSLAKDMANATRLERYGMRKLILCRYRVLLAGLILAREKKVVYNLDEQCKIYPVTLASPLLEAYKEHKMFPRLTKAKRETDNLHRELEKTIEQSHLPNKGVAEIELDRWLVKRYK